MNSEDFIYVLVFNNPYSKCNPSLIKKFLEKVTTEKAEKKFKSCFKLSDTDSIFRNALQELKASLTGKSDIRLEKLNQKVLELVLSLIQNNLGITIKISLSHDNKEISVLLKASDENLMIQAELVKYKLRLVHNEKDLPFKQHPPFGEFNSAAISKQVYQEQKNSIFTRTDQIRLIHSMLLSIIDLSELKSLQLLSFAFPLHTQPLEDLSKTWVKISNFYKPQDIDAVNDYFGEKISMYFAWLEFYITWLMVPAFLGTVAGILIYSSSSDKFELPFMTLGEWSTLIFALLLSISSTLMDQLWIRKQTNLAWKWGVTDYYEHEEQRPEYEGQFQFDPVSGTMKKISASAGALKKCTGYVVTFFFVCLVIASVLGLMIYKAQLIMQKHGTSAQLIGVANAIQIKILNFVKLI